MAVLTEGGGQGGGEGGGRSHRGENKLSRPQLKNRRNAKNRNHETQNKKGKGSEESRVFGDGDLVREVDIIEWVTKKKVEDSTGRTRDALARGKKKIRIGKLRRIENLKKGLRTGKGGQSKYPRKGGPLKRPLSATLA